MFFLVKLLVKMVYKIVMFGGYLDKVSMLLEIFDIIDELLVLSVYVVGGSGQFEILKIFDIIDEEYK